MPLPAGTLLQVHTRSFPDPAAPQFWAPSGIGPAVEAFVVGNQGAIKVTARTAAIGSVSWLHVERTVDDGMRERAFVPLRPTPDSIVLRREQRLAAGQVVDAAGAAVPAHACQLGVAPPSVGGIPARELLGHRWVQRDGRYELWGWPAPGDFQLTGAYLHFGPATPPIALEFGGKDLDVVLPVTGHLQVDLPTPKPFPMGAAFVVMRDLDRGGVLRRFMIPNDATKVRVLTGRYAVKLELSGVEVRDFGTLRVLHNQTTETYHGVLGPAAGLRSRVVPGWDEGEGVDEAAFPSTFIPGCRDRRSWRSVLRGDEAPELAVGRRADEVVDANGLRSPPSLLGACRGWSCYRV